MGSVFGWPDLNTLGSDDLRGERGGTPFPYYLCSGNAVPFEKNQGWWNVVPLSKTRMGERYSRLPR